MANLFDLFIREPPSTVDLNFDIKFFPVNWVVVLL